MVAAGLTPKAVYDGTDTDLDIYLSNLCEFAFAMQECIKRINKHSFNNFQLRIGLSFVRITSPKSMIVYIVGIIEIIELRNRCVKEQIILMKMLSLFVHILRYPLTTKGITSHITITLFVVSI